MFFQVSNPTEGILEEKEIISCNFLEFISRITCEIKINK
jgi:hypothetical protein